MAKGGDTVPSHYPCLVQKDGLRRVHHPHDAYPVPKPHRLRQTLAKLVTVLHR